MDEVVPSQSTKGVFDFGLHVDICELNYEGLWNPVPVKFELTNDEEYQKIYRFLSLL